MKEETKNEANVPLVVGESPNKEAEANTKVQQNQTPSKTEENLYFFLMIFIGHWGVHKFITGKTGMGILYFSTSGLFGIGLLVDMFSFSAGNAKDADGKCIEATAGYKRAAKIIAILMIMSIGLTVVFGILWIMILFIIDSRY